MWDENVWCIVSWIARTMLSLAHLSEIRPLYTRGLFEQCGNPSFGVKRLVYLSSSTFEFPRIACPVDNNFQDKSRRVPSSTEHHSCRLQDRSLSWSMPVWKSHVAHRVAPRNSVWPCSLRGGSFHISRHIISFFSFSIKPLARLGTKLVYCQPSLEGMRAAWIFSFLWSLGRSFGRFGVCFHGCDSLHH